MRKPRFDAAAKPPMLTVMVNVRAAHVAEAMAIAAPLLRSLEEADALGSVSVVRGMCEGEYMANCATFGLEPEGVCEHLGIAPRALAGIAQFASQEETPDVLPGIRCIMIHGVNYEPAEPDGED